MYDDRSRSAKDTSTQMRYQKRVPFTIREVKSKDEIKEWQAKADAKSVRQQAYRRERAIEILYRPQEPIKEPIIQIKESFFIRIYHKCLNWFLNLKFT